MVLPSVAMFRILGSLGAHAKGAARPTLSHIAHKSLTCRLQATHDILPASIWSSGICHETCNPASNCALYY